MQKTKEESWSEKQNSDGRSAALPKYSQQAINNAFLGARQL